MAVDYCGCRTSVCSMCGTCIHERHEPECSTSWRALILSYPRSPFDEPPTVD